MNVESDNLFEPIKIVYGIDKPGDSSNFVITINFTSKPFDNSAMSSLI